MTDSQPRTGAAPRLRVLVVTSLASPDEAVDCVVAALEEAELEVRLLDVGAVGDDEGTLNGFLRALMGDTAEDKLLRELAAAPPEVAIAFDPGATTALMLAREAGHCAASVVAIVANLAPADAWGATNADRYAAVDDEAAVTLADHGVPGGRIVVVGPIVSPPFGRVAQVSRRTMRARYKLPTDLPVVVVEVAGNGYEQTQQIALQLALAAKPAMYLFDAGDDREAATALRAQVPALDLRAKLFGKTKDVAKLWRCADAIIARPTKRAIHRALIYGARLVALQPEDPRAQVEARAMEERGLASIATNMLLLSGALATQLARGSAGGPWEAADGARTIADIAIVVGDDRAGIVGEARRVAEDALHEQIAAESARVDAYDRLTSEAGDLEDLGGGLEDLSATAAAEPTLDDGEIARLRAELNTRVGNAKKRVFQSRQKAEQWDKRRQLALKKNKADLASDAEREADRERRRMHEGLQELQRLEAERQRLDKLAAAPPASRRPPRVTDHRPPPRASGRSEERSTSTIDDMLNKLKREQGSKGTSIDDELAALKAKMNRGGGPKR